MSLGAIPGLDSSQVRAVLGPALLIGRAQRVWVVVTVTRVIALGAREQTQATQPAARAERWRKRKQTAARRASFVHAAALIRAQESACGVPLCERHQRAGLLQEHEATRLAGHVYGIRLEPSNDLRGAFAATCQHSSQISVGQRHAQISAAIAAFGAAKTEVTKAARHAGQACLRSPEHGSRAHSTPQSPSNAAVAVLAISC